jgi:hypothetical protein
MILRSTSPRLSRAATWRMIAVGGAAALIAPLATGTNAAGREPATESGLGPIVAADPQLWEDQAEMTWDDYVPVRPEAWNSAATSQGSESQYQTAVILLDFEDQPFLITQEPGTHPFGNPQSGWEPVAPEDVNQWFYEYYAVPDQYNGGQTMHAYARHLRRTRPRRRTRRPAGHLVVSSRTARTSATNPARRASSSAAVIADVQ